MRVFTCIASLVVLAMPAASAENNIVGTWKIRDAGELDEPAFMIFKNNGTFRFDVFNLGTDAECTYRFDTGGSPAEIGFLCESEGKKTERRMWVAFLSNNTIHIRMQEQGHSDFAYDPSIEFTLDRVSD